MKRISNHHHLLTIPRRTVNKLLGFLSILTKYDMPDNKTASKGLSCYPFSMVDSNHLSFVTSCPFSDP